MNILSLICGCTIPIIFAGVVFISEFHKFWLSWDMRYVGKSWLTIWRAERAYKRGDLHTYSILLHGKEATAMNEEYERRRNSPTLQ